MAERNSLQLCVRVAQTDGCRNVFEGPFTVKIYTNHGNWHVRKTLDDISHLSSQLSHSHSFVESLSNLPQFEYEIEKVNDNEEDKDKHKENDKESDNNNETKTESDNNNNKRKKRIESVNGESFLKELENYLESIVRNKEIFVIKTCLDWFDTPDNIRVLCKKYENLLHKPIFNGWLSYRKQDLITNNNNNNKQRFRQKFFVLHYDYRLSIYQSEQALHMNNQRALDTIDLLNDFDGIMDHYDANKCQFAIYTKTSQEWIFKCETSVKESQWVAYIKTMTHYKNEFSKKFEKFDFNEILNSNSNSIANNNNNNENDEKTTDTSDEMKNGIIPNDLTTELTNEIEKYKNEFISLNEKNNQLKNENEKILKNLKIQENENLKLKGKIHRLQLMIDEKTKEMNHLKETNESLLNAQNELYDEIEQLTLIHSKTIEETQNVAKHVSTIIEKHDTNVKQMEKEMEMKQELFENDIIKGQLYKYDGKSIENVKITKDPKPRFVTYIASEKLLIYSNDLRSPQSKKMKIEKVITSNARIAANIPKKYRNKWFVVTNKDRVLLFATDSIDEFRKWFKAISHSIVVDDDRTVLPKSKSVMNTLVTSHSNGNVNNKNSNQNDDNMNHVRGKMRRKSCNDLRLSTSMKARHENENEKENEESIDYAREKLHKLMKMNPNDNEIYAKSMNRLQRRGSMSVISRSGIDVSVETPSMNLDFESMSHNVADTFEVNDLSN